MLHTLRSSLRLILTSSLNCIFFEYPTTSNDYIEHQPDKMVPCSIEAWPVETHQVHARNAFELQTRLEFNKFAGDISLGDFWSNLFDIPYSTAAPGSGLWL